MADLIFLVTCGGCPKWKRDGKKSETVDGFCKKLKEARHCRRELCPEMWEHEVSRLCKLAKLKASQKKIILKDGRELNPRLACEGAGVEWPGLDRIKK